MTHERGTGAAPVRRAGRTATLVGGGAVVALAVVALLPGWSTNPLLALVNLAVTVGLGLTAVLLADEPGQGPNVRAFLLAAAFWTAGYVGVLSPLGPWALLQWALGPLVFPVLVAVLLRHPRPRPPGPTERLLPVGLAAALVVIRWISVVVSEPEWHGFDARAWWPTVLPAPAVSVACDAALPILGVVVAPLFAVLATRRLLRADGVDRRLLRPVGLAAVAMAVVVGAEVTSRIADPGPAITGVVVGVEALGLLAIPVAFGVAALRRRLAHAAMSGLVVALARPVTPEGVRWALAESLGDPTLRVIYHRPDGEGHVDSARDDDATPSATRCARTVEAADGTVLATLDMHESLRRHPNLVDAAVSAARLALENGRLQETTRASLEEVRESRARIISASDDARRRLERDLHDGVQQRLLALKTGVGVARGRATAPDERTLLDTVRAELQETLDELRDLARGIHPAVLTDGGLRPAMRSVADRLPLEVELRIDVERFEPIVEATAYYVCCEALTNAVKHANATRAVVEAAHRGSVLRLSVRDGGRGGACEKVGGGLAGLRDRVTAIGGRMTVVSDDGGTTVRVELPCAS